MECQKTKGKRLTHSDRVLKHKQESRFDELELERRLEDRPRHRACDPESLLGS